MRRCLQKCVCFAQAHTSSILRQVKVHIDLPKKVNAITLNGLKADCLPFSGGEVMTFISMRAHNTCSDQRAGATDKLASAIAKQQKLIAQSGIGFCFPTMVVSDYLPSWAMVCKNDATRFCTLRYAHVYLTGGQRGRRIRGHEAGHDPMDRRLSKHGAGSSSQRGMSVLLHSCD